MQHVGYIASILAGAEHFWGDRDAGNRVCNAARDAATRKPPNPLANVTFRYKTQPFDLLREFYAVSKTDKAAASLVVATLVRVVTDGFLR